MPADLVDLDNEPADNLKALSQAKGVPVSDLVVCILDRPRNGEIIAKTREAGARIMLIVDGDVSGVIATAWPKSGIDLYCGIGGAPQGVLSAAALACVGGQMQGRLVIRDNAERQKRFKEIPSLIQRATFLVSRLPFFRNTRTRVTTRLVTFPYRVAKCRKVWLDKT